MDRPTLDTEVAGGVLRQGELDIEWGTDNTHADAVAWYLQTAYALRVQRSAARSTS